jgi:hypothetical protein
MRSPEFASLWAAHPVQKCTSGVKQFHHPELGHLDLGFEVLHLPDAPGQRLLTHAPDPGSPAEVSLALLRASSVTSASPRSSTLRR